MGKLPVWETIEDSLEFCSKHIGAMFKFALMPFVLSLSIIGIGLALSTFYDLSGSNGGQLAFNLVVISVDLLTMVIILPFMTAWHRYYFNRKHQTVKWFNYKVSQKEIGYFFCWFVLLVIVLVLVFLPIVAGTGGASMSAFELDLGYLCLLIVAVFAIPFVIVRLSMIFPATAIGLPIELKFSWQLTKGSFWRIFTVYMTISIIIITSFTIVSFSLSYIVQEVILLGREISQITMEFLIAALLLPIKIIGIALAAACLSITYNHIFHMDDGVTDQVDDLNILDAIDLAAEIDNLT